MNIAMLNTFKGWRSRSHSSGTVEGSRSKPKHTRPSRHTTKTMAAWFISNVESYPTKRAELLTAPAPHYIVFNADPDPATGLPWCPDCVRTLPSVREAVANAGGALLEVQVGPRPVWKSPDHPLRLDPILKLTGIPTLLKVSPTGDELARLGKDLEACRTPSDAAKLLATFTAES